MALNDGMQLISKTHGPEDVAGPSVTTHSNEDPTAGLGPGQPQPVPMPKLEPGGEPAGSGGSSGSGNFEGSLPGPSSGQSGSSANSTFQIGNQAITQRRLNFWLSVLTLGLLLIDIWQGVSN